MIWFQRRKSHISGSNSSPSTSLSITTSSNSPTTNTHIHNKSYSYEWYICHMKNCASHFQYWNTHFLSWCWWLIFLSWINHISKSHLLSLDGLCTMTGHDVCGGVLFLGILVGKLIVFKPTNTHLLPGWSTLWNYVFKPVASENDPQKSWACTRREIN